MSDETKSYVQLIAEFPDNNQGLISPQDARDFITTTFPYQAAFDPNNNCDLVNTAGVPNATGFDTGNTWLNTSAGTWWFCLSGTFGAAVWVQIAFTGDIPIVNDWFLCRLRLLYGYESAMISPTLSGYINAGIPTIGSVSSADLAYVNGGAALLPSGGFPLGTVALAVDFDAGSISVSQTATGTGPITFTATPLTYGFDEWELNSVTGAPSPKSGGRGGDYDVTPLIEVNGQNLEGARPLVYARYVKQTTSGLPLYEFEYALPSLPENASFNEVTVTNGTQTTTILPGGVTSPDITTPLITITPTTGTPPTAPGSLYVPSTAGNPPDYVGTTGSPGTVTIGGPTVVEFVIPYSKFTAFSSTVFRATVTSLTVPQLVSGLTCLQTATFAATTGVLSSGVVEQLVGSAATSLQSLPATASVNWTAPALQNYTAVNNGSWSIIVNLTWTTSFATLTAGSVTIKMTIG